MIKMARSVCKIKREAISLLIKNWKISILVCALISIGLIGYNKFIWKPRKPSEARSVEELRGFIPQRPDLDSNVDLWKETLEALVANKKFSSLWPVFELEFVSALRANIDESSKKGVKSDVVILVPLLQFLISTSQGLNFCMENYQEQDFCRVLHESNSVILSAYLKGSDLQSAKHSISAAEGMVEGLVLKIKQSGSSERLLQEKKYAERQLASAENELDMRIEEITNSVDIKAVRDIVLFFLNKYSAKGK